MVKYLAALLLVVGLVWAGGTADAHSRCETNPHSPTYLEKHLIDFTCSGTFGIQCGTSEVWVKAAYTGFGFTDSYGTARLWATSVGGTTQSRSQTRDWDAKYARLVTTLHNASWVSVDQVGMAAIGRVTLSAGCVNNTIGSPYLAVGNV